MSIPRGVTPTLTFTFDDDDLDLTQASHVYVTFRGGMEVTKADDELTVAEKQIDVYLTQEETLSFRPGSVYVQVNWTYPDGSRAASDVAIFKFSSQLLDKVVE